MNITSRHQISQREYLKIWKDMIERMYFGFSDRSSKNHFQNPWGGPGMTPLTPEVIAWRVYKNQLLSPVISDKKKQTLAPFR